MKNDLEINNVTLETVREKIKEFVECFSHLSIKDIPKVIIILEDEFTKLFEDLELSLDMVESKKSSFKNLIEFVNEKKVTGRKNEY